MKKMLQRLFLMFVLAFCLTGCASIKVNSTEKAKVNNVAVYSMMGNDMVHNDIGITIFDTTYGTIPVEGWNIDAYVEDEVISAYAPKYTMKKLYEANEIRPQTITRSFTGMPENLIEEAKRKGFDTLIVVGGHFGDMDGCRQSGYGIIRCKGVIERKEAHIFAFSSMIIYDVDQGKFIGSSVSYDVVDGLINEPTSAHILTDPIWKDDSDSYSPEEIAKFEEQIKSLLKQGIAYAIGQIGL